MVSHLEKIKSGLNLRKVGPQQIIAAARHLAEHYRRANRPLPEALDALLK